uniref:RIC3 domain-containing protein n=1 Tax=Panagrellus redivivus TaxID=6233 RepID=A0A7E4VXB4_PANRE
MRDFVPLPTDKHSLPDDTAGGSAEIAPDIPYKSAKKDVMSTKSRFHFHSFGEFISDPTVLILFAFTALIAVLIPITVALIRHFYKKMNADKIIFSQDKFVEDKQKLIDEDTENIIDNETSQIDANSILPLSDLTEEERVLLAGTIDADDGDGAPDVLGALSNIRLHGKLATAQLRARQQKIVGGMTDEELEQERATRDEQLAKIFAMMTEQRDKFGIETPDELNEQLKMYSI